jgi:hypothetical protein
MLLSSGCEMGIVRVKGAMFAWIHKIAQAERLLNIALKSQFTAVVEGKRCFSRIIGLV